MAAWNDYFRCFEGESADTSLAEPMLASIEDLWASARERVGPDRFDAVLGDLNRGTLTRASTHAWVMTNGKKGSDFVNMTIELGAKELSVNVVGWFDPQLEHLTGWLRTSAARKFLAPMTDLCVVVFVRTAQTGNTGKGVFKGAEGREVDRLRLTETSPANITTKLTTQRASLDSDTEKLSVHIRRSWTPEEVVSSTDLDEEVSSAVEPWLPVLPEIRGGGNWS